MAEKTPATHSLLDNLQGQASGVLMTSFAVIILQSAGLVTGQTAGLSLLISYISGWSFGAVFFVVNIPFYAFAFKRMGWRFTVRSLASATLISVLANSAHEVITIAEINIWVAALLGGCTAAMGLIALFRHGASAGGLGILALYVQDKTGFRAGWLQLIVDAMIFTASAFFLDGWAVAASFMGAAVVNILIAFNHRKDWYVAQ